LESSPSAYVVYEHSGKIGAMADRIIEELAQTWTMG
jgi:hypothetical protein